ncbi:hypothetical protein H6P81_015175 [Aristolochia fimbriata]|uniref:Uncharacterized protein n=1 Tax=Aristolochia fimbriata TaxID=158543 RepID=A0AAV7E4J5_ARIFI|nr:hypothetical protein H6P81_015175 [Aristolochia fimbriata]
MSYSSLHLCIFTFTGVLLLCIAPLPVFSSEYDRKNTSAAYNVLEQNDFPRGLLPHGATGYELDPKTGRFSVFFNGSCSFSLPDSSYRLSYASVITGTISKGKLKNLGGVRVKVLFFWLRIDQVVRKGDELEFSVRFTSASFPIDNFVEPPHCGCGFECTADGGSRRMRRRWPVSLFFLNLIY